MASIEHSIDEHVAKLEKEKEEYDLLQSAQKRARKLQTYEKVGHFMFRKSEALIRHSEIR